MNLEQVFSFENMYNSAKQCCNGVRWKTSTQNFESQLMLNANKLRKQVLSGKYKSKGFHNFTIKDRGKTREIQSVHISERVVQKCLCDYYLVPRFTPTFIYDNGACMKGKGTGFAVRRAKQHLHKYSLKHGNSGYILLFDIANFFGSINHDVLLDMVKDKFEDERVYKLYEYFIRCFKGDTGLGLGSQVSQVSSLLYLNPLDHTIKDVLGMKYYGRYMDDGYIISDSKEKLQECLMAMEQVLDKLKLKLHKNKTQIVRLKDGFTFLKRRFILHDDKKIVLKPSKKNILRYKRKYKKLKKKGNIDALVVIRQAFKGYLKEFNYYDRYTPKGV